MARSFQYAINIGQTKEELAAQYGVSKETIRKRLALLELPPETQKRIAEGRLAPTKALAPPAESANGPSKPRLRSRKEIEAAYGEFTVTSAEGKALA